MSSTNTMLASLVADKVTLMTQLAAAKSALASLSILLNSEELDDAVVRAAAFEVVSDLSAMPKAGA